MAELDADLFTGMCEQIAHELSNHDLYLQLSARCAAHTPPFDGFAAFYRHEAAGEAEHARRMIDYLIARKTDPAWTTISQTMPAAGQIVDYAVAQLARELETTERITDLFLLARERGDMQTEQALAWFVTEQTEEVELAADLVQRLKAAGDQYPALLLLDAAYGSRAA